MNKKNRFILAGTALLLAFILALFVGQVHGALSGVVFYVLADLAVLPMVAERDRLYANDFGTLSTGLILVAALEQAIKLRPALSKVTLDWSAEPAVKGDVIRSRVIGAASVQNFGTGAQDRTDADAGITLSAFKEVCHTFTAAEISATRRNLVQESAAPMAEALGDYFMDLLGALWAATTFTNSTTIATASYDYTTLTGLNATLSADARAVPKKGRFGVVNSDVYKSLLEDPLCNRAQKVAGDDPISTGVLGAIAGFENIHEHPGLPSTNNTNGWFGTRGATALVVRPPRNPADLFPSIPANGNIGVVSIPDPNDPESPGLSVLAIEVIDLLTLSATVKIAFLAGAGVVRESFGQRTKTA